MQASVSNVSHDMLWYGGIMWHCEACGSRHVACVYGSGHVRKLASDWLHTVIIQGRRKAIFMPIQL